jgi:hypothetical protein
MREEKVKAIPLSGEKAAISHGRSFIFKPGDKKRSPGEPAKT